MAKIDEFVHLHTHTHFSILDGHGTPSDILDVVAEQGQPAVAFTDHGNMNGLYDGFQAAKQRGVGFIGGIEAYLAPSHVSHTHKKAAFFADGGPDDVSGNGAYTHITLLAENNEGLSNLFKLQQIATLEGMYRKPRMSLETLSEHSANIIATTGCPSGEVQTRLRLGQYDQALGFASKLVDIFGQDSVFVELMDHNMTIDLERKVRLDLLRIAATLNLPLVATNDVHYAREGDCKSHEELLAIQSGSGMSEPPLHKGGKRFAFEGSSYYVKSAEQMRNIFPEDQFPGAVKNTLAIAERCSLEIVYNDTLRPHFPLPEGWTESADYLRHLVYQGLRERLPDKVHDQVYLDRIQLELSVIIPKNYSDYFLVTQDLMKWARSQGIRQGSGRGSAGGSLVSYLTYITDVEPVKHGLLFERFLNPERDSFPDVDLDFDDRYRDRVYKYVVDKYGTDYVAQVATFTGMKGKNSLKDIARIYEHPYAVGDMLSKAYPEAIFGKDMPLRDVYNKDSARYDEAESFRKKVNEMQVEDVVASALKVEGRVRGTSVHACAVIISDRPITETAPVSWNEKKEVNVVGWEYPACESIGLLKMDFLGLRNLGIIDDALKLIKLKRGIDIDIEEIKQGPMDDPLAYKLLSEGNTLGVFQLDSGPMRDLLKLMKPTNFNDISAVLALYRPGPMGVDAHINYALRKNGLQEVIPIHPELEVPLAEVLSETYGLITYQEQVMKIAQVISGYSLAEADLLRRAMGKKKREEMDQQWDRFHSGGVENGYSEEALKTLWDVLVPFSDYAFNKSHSVAYGYTSYLTAYLKAHYPAEYMSALLTSTSDDKTKTALYLDDAKQNKLKVLPPDIQHSEKDYAPLNQHTILFGLKAIRNVSDIAADRIVEERRKNGPFKDFSDVINRIPHEAVNKKIMEALAYGGAFDSLGYTRKSLIDSMEFMLTNYKKALASKKKKAAMGVDLFAGLDFEEELQPRYEPYEAPEYTNLVKLQFERDFLGLYVSGHPLDGLNFDSISSTKVIEILSERVPIVPDGQYPQRGKEPIITISGLVSSWATRPTKKGKLFGMGVLEDRTESIDFVMFSKTFDEYNSIMRVDGLYALTGYPQKRGEGYSFVLNSVRPLEFTASGNLPVRLRVTVDQYEKGYHDLLSRLQVHQATVHNPKATDVIVSIRQYDGSVTEETLPFKVQPSPLLAAEIRELFGMTAIGRWRARPPVGVNKG